MRQRVNNPLLNLNPAINSSLGLTFTQPLLRGFGPAVNKRYIRIAKNNLQIADFVFRQQVIATVSGVVRLYWDLASLNEDVRVRQEAVASAEQFLSDNKNQIEAGTVAPVDVTRAQAELSRRKRDLAVAKSLVRQEEAVLKDYLTRSPLDSTLANAPIVLSDRMAIPPQERIEPLNDLVAKALRTAAGCGAGAAADHQFADQSAGQQERAAAGARSGRQRAEQRTGGPAERLARSASGNPLLGGAAATAS